MINSENNLVQKLTVIGISHKTASVAEREIFQLSRKEIINALNAIFNYNEVESIIIVSSCNRIEFYMIILPETSPSDIIKRFYSSKSINIDNFEKLFYIFEGEEVTRHLFKVISGLDSLVLGEYQIQGQVKDAYSVACEAKTVDKILHKLYHAAFRTGKKVRSTTSIGEGKQSVSGVASQIIIDNAKKNETIAIIGVNENTKIVAQELTSTGFSNFIFINRTIFKAEMLAAQFGGKAYGLDLIEKAFSESQVVFTSTGAPGYIVSSEMLRRLAVQERCPRLIIDMAVPRDIDTSSLPKYIKSYDIGDLQEYLDKQKQQQLVAVPEAEKIIESEVLVYQAWSDTQKNDILEPYAEKLEQVRQQVLEEFRPQFSSIAIDRAEKMSRHLLHRLQSEFIRVLIKRQQNLMVNSD